MKTKENYCRIDDRGGQRSFLCDCSMSSVKRCKYYEKPEDSSSSWWCKNMQFIYACESEDARTDALCVLTLENI